MNSQNRRRAAVLTMLFVLGVAAVIPRYVRLGADFPIHLTSSEAPYTDEGWYSNSAVRHVQRGQWLLEHDVNEATVMPLFHIAQRLAFAVGGLSFETARVVAQTLFLLMAAGLSWLVRRESGTWALGVFAALMLSNFTLFSYSRIALVELPMLLPIALGLCILHGAALREPLLRGVTLGAAVAGAALFKLSALFAGPAFLLISVLSGTTRRDRSQGFVGFVLGAAIAAGVWAFQLLRHRQDFLHSVNALVVGPQRTESLPLTTTVRTALTDLIRLDPPLLTAVALAVFFTLQNAWRDREKRHPITRLDIQLLLLMSLSWVVPAATKYQPTRYFVPVLVFAAALVAVNCGHLAKERHRLVVLLLGPVALSVFLGGRDCANHLLHARTTFRDATIQMRQHFDAETVLMGDTAPQIALGANVWAVSGHLGRGRAADRAYEHRPTHYVARGPLGVPEQTLFERNSCIVELIERYPVFSADTDRNTEVALAGWTQQTELSEDPQRTSQRALYLYRLEGCSWPSEEPTRQAQPNQ